jgi:transcriptional regulator with XRE-family HTH domain
MKMRPADYKFERERRGTQTRVAALLGVSRVSISRRENGRQKITREAELALVSIPPLSATKLYVQES